MDGPTPGGDVLSSVAVRTARSAWVAGATGSDDGPAKTLILRRNGTSWTKVTTPSPRASASLSGVAIVSARGAWALGATSTRQHADFRTLILRWNGKSWS